MDAVILAPAAEAIGRKRMKTTIKFYSDKSKSSGTD
jgi:hypothetical protein